MNILFTRFPLESAHGGAEIQTLSLMKGLRERGHAVSFLGSCPVMLDLSTAENIECTRLHIGPPPVTKQGTVRFFWRQVTMRAKLKKAFEDANAKKPIEAIVMMSLSEKLLLTPIALAHNVRVFWLEHDKVGRWLRKNPWLGLLQKLSKNVTTICVSELSKKIYTELGFAPEHIVTIPNGIDFARFSQGGSPLTPVHSLRVGCVARLSKEKGVDLLIRAMQNTHDAQLEIVGDGPERESLRILSNKLDLEGRIQFLGRQEDLGAFYESIDVLVLPSRQHDPFGLVAAEAMLVGTPVIVTDICGIADYLNETNAVVVAHNSQRALEEGLQIMMDPKKRSSYSVQGAKTAQSTFSIHAMVDKYEELLRK